MNVSSNFDRILANISSSCMCIGCIVIIQTAYIYSGGRRACGPFCCRHFALGFGSGQRVSSVLPRHTHAGADMGGLGMTDAHVGQRLGARHIGNTIPMHMSTSRHACPRARSEQATHLQQTYVLPPSYVDSERLPAPSCERMTTKLSTCKASAPHTQCGLGCQPTD